MLIQYTPSPIVNLKDAYAFVHRLEPYFFLTISGCFFNRTVGQAALAGLFGRQFFPNFSIILLRS